MLFPNVITTGGNDREVDRTFPKYLIGDVEFAALRISVCLAASKLPPTICISRCWHHGALFGGGKQLRG